MRFAPSPTGYFHVGGAKTSLYNWIYARQHGGTFVLRIEDTDAERNKPEWIDGIQSAMQWIRTGLDEYGPAWDEGPYFQSHNATAHVDAGHRLFERAMRTTATARASRSMPATPRIEPRPVNSAPATTATAAIGATRRRPVARCGSGRPTTASPWSSTSSAATPSSPTTTSRTSSILRGNGSPMFLLANVVDDIDMRITHVIRAEEHLPNTPKAQLLWKALDGGPLPMFAHVPLLVNEKRQKLSKRRDPVALEMYRDRGLPARGDAQLLDDARLVAAGDDEVVPWDRGSCASSVSRT